MASCVKLRCGCPLHNFDTSVTLSGSSKHNVIKPPASNECNLMSACNRTLPEMALIITHLHISRLEEAEFCLCAVLWILHCFVFFIVTAFKKSRGPSVAKYQLKSSMKWKWPAIQGNSGYKPLFIFYFIYCAKTKQKTENNSSSFTFSSFSSDLLKKKKSTKEINFMTDRLLATYFSSCKANYTNCF